MTEQKTASVKSEKKEIKKRKSKFDLEGFAHCKIPKAQRAELKKFTDNTNIHWAEVVRMIVQKWIVNDGRIIELEKVGE